MEQEQERPELCTCDGLEALASDREVRVSLHPSGTVTAAIAQRTDSHGFAKAHVQTRHGQTDVVVQCTYLKQSMCGANLALYSPWLSGR